MIIFKNDNEPQEQSLNNIQSLNDIQSSSSSTSSTDNITKTLKLTTIDKIIGECINLLHNRKIYDNGKINENIEKVKDKHYPIINKKNIFYEVNTKVDVIKISLPTKVESAVLDKMISKVVNCLTKRYNEITERDKINYNYNNKSNEQISQNYSFTTSVVIIPNEEKKIIFISEKEYNSGLKTNNIHKKEYYDLYKTTKTISKSLDDYNHIFIVSTDMMKLPLYDEIEQLSNDDKFNRYNSNEAKYHKIKDIITNDYNLLSSYITAILVDIYDILTLSNNQEIDNLCLKHIRMFNYINNKNSTSVKMSKYYNLALHEYSKNNMLMLNVDFKYLIYEKNINDVKTTPIPIIKNNVKCYEDDRCIQCKMKLFDDNYVLSDIRNDVYEALKDNNGNNEHNKIRPLMVYSVQICPKCMNNLSGLQLLFNKVYRVKFPTNYETFLNTIDDEQKPNDIIEQKYKYHIIDKYKVELFTLLHKNNITYKDIIGKTGLKIGNTIMTSNDMKKFLICPMNMSSLTMSSLTNFNYYCVINP